VSAQARPQDYAAAIYDLAFESWTRQLTHVQQALNRDAALRTALGDPNKSSQDKLLLLSQAVPEGLSAEVRKFLGTLLEGGQLGQLDAIMAEFDRLVRRRPEHKTALITSAVALTEAEKESLRVRLADRYGPDLEIQYRVDASLIGGVRLRVGDQVIDGTVAGKLAALREHLST
jgi:F-type H+-transporting ATPase subunit delta